MPKTVPHGPGLEPGSLPFSKVVEANGFVFLAGQIGDAPGYAYDSGCDFVVSYFQFESIASADLPAGRRFEAVPAAPLVRAA